MTFARDFWYKAQENKAAKTPHPQIDEMELSGAKKLSDHKQEWLSADPEPRGHLQKDKNGRKGVALEPMRIRTFVIDYNDDAVEQASNEKVN